MGKTSRRQGMEWRIATWMARHPLTTATPAALTAGVAEFGPTTVGVALAGLGAAGVSWSRAHPETFDAHAAPRLRAVHRRWVRYIGWRWRDILDACGLTREHRKTGRLLVPRLVRVRSASPSIDTIYVRILRGQALKHYQDRQDELAAALKADAIGIIRVKPQLIAITVVRGNPFADVIDPADIPPEAADVDLTSLYLGEDEYGNEWTEPLLGHHWFGGGATGSGKSSLLWNPLRAMGPAIRDRQVLVDMCDLKGGMETAAATPLFHRYADEAQGALEVIEGFRDDMVDRQKDLAAAGQRKFSLSTDTPFRVLQIDELAMMTALGGREITKDANRLLAEIMTQGRATGFAVCAYVQEPTKDVVPIRDLFTRRICLRVTSAQHVDMLLGEDMRLRGALADEIPADEEHTGTGFRVDQRSRRPIRIRAGHVTDDGITELVNECTPTETTVEGSNVVEFPHHTEETA